jgi:hypothetical protein
MIAQRRSKLRELARASSLAATALALGLGLARPYAHGQEYVPSPDLSHPKIRYGDSLVSLNDRCPVRQGKLNGTYAPVYVNRYPVGFC